MEASKEVFTTNIKFKDVQKLIKDMTEEEIKYCLNRTLSGFPIRQDDRHFAEEVAVGLKGRALQYKFDLAYREIKGDK